MSGRNTSRIRILNKNDWAAWKQIRLEAIKLHPEAFGGSFEDEAQNSVANFQRTLSNNSVFAAFLKDDLVGVAGFFVHSQRKSRHRGQLFSMYLKAEYRGSGIADQLLKAVIHHAKNKVLQLHCSVVTTNMAAIKIYQNNGFTIYGTEPRSLKVNEVFYDEHLMVQNNRLVSSDAR
jgi:ribosomal protein S18 acetylase RimI-like enzyme